jgi:hypothetical protein
MALVCSRSNATKPFVVVALATKPFVVVALATKPFVVVALATEAITSLLQTMI